MARLNLCVELDLKYDVELGYILESVTEESSIVICLGKCSPTIHCHIDDNEFYIE
jgi:hypothetical protein